MSQDSRTEKSIKNAKVSLFFMIATFLLNFLSRKFFLDGLGAELMGMRTVLGSVLSMLSLSELGIGSSVAVALYRPLLDKDYNKINEIISLQGWLYTRVFAFISLGIIILMGVLPIWLSELNSTQLIYAYLTLGIFFIGTMLSYTVNYKSIVLTADQKGYKTSMIMSSAGLIKSVIQLLILKYIASPYPYWLAMDLLIALLGVYVIDRVTKREYPWLVINKKRGAEYFKKYPEIIKHTKQLFIHSITTFALTQGTPLVVSAVGLAMVTNYENYKNLVANIRATIYAVFTNMGAAIASLIAEDDREKAYNFFWEMLSLKYLVGGVAAFGLLNFGTPFISIWLGADYAFPLSTTILITAIAYLDYTRGTIDSYIVGYKLFSDIWAPATEGIINVVLMIVLGRMFGIDGILAGTYISLLLIIRLWKPYLLFTKGFERSVWDYWRGNVKFLVITIALMIVSYLWINSLELNLASSYLNLFRHVAWLTPLYASALFVAFYLTSTGFRKVSKRLWGLAEPKLLAAKRVIFRQ